MMRLSEICRVVFRQGGKRREALSATAALAITAACAFLASAAQAAGPAEIVLPQRLFAANCKSPECGLAHTTVGPSSSPTEVEEVGEPTLTEAEKGGFRTAGGYVPYGVTALQFNAVELTKEAESLGLSAKEAEELYAGSLFGADLVPAGFLATEGLSSVGYLRTDVAQGVVTNPFAVPQCSQEAFKGIELPPEKPGEPPLYIYPENKVPCPLDTVIGVNTVLTAAKPLPNAEPKKFAAVKLQGLVYNLTPLSGFAATYGAALYTGKEIELEGKRFKLFVHTIIEGNVEWATNYHDYFEIHNIPPGLIYSRLLFFGNKQVKSVEEVPVFAIAPEESEAVAKTGHKIFLNPTKELKYTLNEEPAGRTTFLRNPTACVPPGPETTNVASAVTDQKQPITLSYTDLVGTIECENEFPFGAENISFSVESPNGGSDQPDGIATTLAAKHPTAESGKADLSDLKVATVVLPPGMTMNPSAAAGLEGCTPEEIGIGTRNPTTCPPGSKIGTVSLEVPTLPAGSLSGDIYLGKPANGPITGPPYTIYLDAESARYGVKVRLRGEIKPNPQTGQLVTTFPENPEAPFNSVTLRFRTGPLAPLANQLTCGEAVTSVTLTPYSGVPAAFSPTVPPFTISGCPTGGPSFAPPGLAQEVTLLPTQAGSTTTFTFKVVRGEGQRYLQTIKTVLPEGLVGEVPKVTPCPEAQANAGTCPPESEIGTISVQAGSGPDPYTFTGTVYFTEHYEGAPYGLSIVVPAVAGPFSLGNVITRAKVEVEPYTAQVVAIAALPTIVQGIPIRLRSMTLTLDRAGFYRNPTSCNPLPLVTTLGGNLGPSQPVSAKANLESKVQTSNCQALPFKPAFAARTSAHHTRLGGAALTVTIGQVEGEAAIKESITTLPLKLPSRLATLEKACPEQVGNANPLSCPSTSLVGHAKAVTPTLPGVMEGPVYIVSEGGRAFPNLVPVLEGDGVRVILVGNTDIHNGITTTTFAANPDVPITSFQLDLPMGPHSLLAGNGNFCRTPLYMPTTLVGQNGKQLVQRTKIEVSGCLTVVRHRRLRRFLMLGVKVPQAGKVAVVGVGLKRTVRKVNHAGLFAIKVPLGPAGLRAIRRHHKLVVNVRIRFQPKLRGGASFATFAKVVLP